MTGHRDDLMKEPGDRGGDVSSDFRDVVDQLDRLAEAERAGAPRGLEADVASAVSRALHPAPIPIGGGEEVGQTTRAGWIAQGWRAAAVIGLVGAAGGLAWLATKPGGSPGSAENVLAESTVSEDVDLLLAALDADFGLANAPAMLELDAQAIESELERGWASPETGEVDAAIWEAI